MLSIDNKLLTRKKLSFFLKAGARKIFPRAVYKRTATLWHWRRQAGWTFKNLIRYGRPKVLLYFGGAPGDDMLCTVVLRELKRRGFEKLWMMSNHPDLYRGNKDVEQVVSVDLRFRDYVSTFGGRWQFLEYAPFIRERDISLQPKRHIIAELCARAGIEGEIILRPYFYLTNSEIASTAWSKEFIAIQSSGLGGIMPMQNKQWFPERYQEVVTRLKNRFQFVQIGSSNDPALADAVDLRGKTKIRETAALLANCRLYIGNVGFLMHLARSVECPSVILYGGREAPWQSGYSCNMNLFSAMSCAPCWLWNTCDYDRLCMKSITAHEVIRAVEQIIERPRNPLIEDKLKL